MKSYVDIQHLSGVDKYTLFELHKQGPLYDNVMVLSKVQNRDFFLDFAC